jgi:hypothetical protein
MKRINGLYLLGMVAVFVTTGCAGTGGGAGWNIPTPAGTAVSMATIKGLMYGTAPPGSEVIFNLNGSDSQGTSWTGSYTVVSDGPTTFESQNVTRSRTLMALQKGSGTRITVTSSRYYLISNSTLYKIVFSLGGTSVPTTQTVIPDIIRVGEFQNFLNTANSDGTTTAATWSMEAGYEGNTKFILSAVIKNGATITATEEDTYYLDPSGKPYQMKVSVTGNGVTTNMTGIMNR